MERITVRVSGVGPIGFCRCVTPCTLATLREAMEEQLADAIPREGFRFLSSGVTVSIAQEPGEDLMEGDVFIVALPPGSAADAAHGSASPAPGSGSMLARAPARSLLQQWVEAFGFMAADEQREAVGLLRLRHPAAASLLGGRGGERRVPSSPASTPRRQARRPAAPQQMPPWSPAGSASRAPVSLDERITAQYYANQGVAAQRGSPGRQLTTPRSASRAARPSPSRLYDEGTVITHLRSAQRDEARRSGRAGVVRGEGRADAAAHNTFTATLRRSPDGRPVPPGPEPVHPCSTESINGFETGSSDGHLDVERMHSPQNFLSSHTGHSLSSASFNAAPSSRSRGCSSARSVGSSNDGAPSSPVAFGSGRPQRPDLASRSGSTHVPKIGSQGAVSGIY